MSSESGGLPVSAETIAILGAGAMGSALTTPLLRAGHRVHLWGTERDDHLLAAIRDGEPHPRLGVVIDRATRLFPSAKLAQALDGVALVVLAITSTGATEIFLRALEHLPSGCPVLIVSKGFRHDRAGRVRLIPDALDAEAPGRHPFLGIAGPCKANEVAAARPTIAVFAAADQPLRERCRSLFATEMYTPVLSDDLCGVELAAATKNAYAIALGICDGLSQGPGQPWHNLKAVLFAQSIAEMGVLAGALGGRIETVYGFSGLGDLEVTALSGRNRALGEAIGSGTTAGAAILDMEARGQTVEGPAAAAMAWSLAHELGLDCRPGSTRLPLLAALVRILDGTVPPLPLLADLVHALGAARATVPSPDVAKISRKV